VLLNRGGGAFTAVLEAPGSCCGESSVAMTDLNGDGKLDIAFMNLGESEVNVLLNQGFGFFGDAIRYPTGDGALAMAVADVNGDGIPDFLTGNWDRQDVSVLLGRCLP
jgi:hypothetical protein